METAASLLFVVSRSAHLYTRRLLYSLRPFTRHFCPGSPVCARRTKNLCNAVLVTARKNAASLPVLHAVADRMRPAATPHRQLVNQTRWRPRRELNCSESQRLNFRNFRKVYDHFSIGDRVERIPFLRDDVQAQARFPGSRLIRSNRFSECVRLARTRVMLTDSIFESILASMSDPQILSGGDQASRWLDERES